MSKRIVEIIKETPADHNHQVVSLVTSGADSMAHRIKPCQTCPWRKDAVGEFPSEAFRISAHTAYDMAREPFACHSSGKSRPATCAGFLLRGADHNRSVRIAYIASRLTNDFHDGGHELFDSYRDMAIANGVDPDDPIIAPCR
jgi:hypothetical protein